MNSYQTLKGFRDFPPGEAAKRTWLRNKLSDICATWGYEPLETPTLEPLEIFTGQIGEDEKLFFSFKDQGGRDVALRYDQTVPTCRYIGENQNTLTFPFKRYQIQPAFRAEKPQKGRYREFTQVDADIFGVKTPDADAEVIALSLDIYRQLGFKRALVRINSRSLMKDIPYPALASIDKLRKIGEAGVITDMTEKGIAESDARGYLGLIRTIEPNEEIRIITDYLNAYGFPGDWYEFDPTIARSFSYSEGPIWEVEIPDAGNLSVLGGERYDGLLARFTGRDIGGTGFGLGFDRTLEAVEAMGLLTALTTAGTVLVTVFDAGSLPRSLALARRLRDSGISTDVYPAADKLDKQLRYADRKSIPYVIIQGPEEQEKGVVAVKNMKEKTQKTMTVEEVLETL